MSDTRDDRDIITDYLGLNRETSGNEFWNAPVKREDVDIEAAILRWADSASRRGPQPLVLHPNDLTGPCGDLLRKLGYIP